MPSRVSFKPSSLFSVKKTMFQSPAKRAVPGLNLLTDSRAQDAELLAESPKMQPLVMATPTTSDRRRPSEKLLAEEMAGMELIEMCGSQQDYSVFTAKWCICATMVGNFLLCSCSPWAELIEILEILGFSAAARLQRVHLRDNGERVVARKRRRGSSELLASEPASVPMRWS